MFKAAKFGHGSLTPVIRRVTSVGRRVNSVNILMVKMHIFSILMIKTVHRDTCIIYVNVIIAHCGLADCVKKVQIVFYFGMFS